MKMQLRLTVLVNLKGAGAREGGNLSPLAPRPHGDTSIEKRCPLLGWGPSNGHCPADPPGAAGTDGCLVKLSLSGRSLLGCRGLLGCDTKSSSCFAQISETAALWEQKKSDVWNTRAQNKDEMTCSKMYFFMSHGIPQLSSSSFCY